MADTINIAGLDKAAVLAALYNGSRPMGMGAFQARPGDMTIEQARVVIENGTPDYGKGFGINENLRFDYVFGRPLKIDIGGDELRAGLYDRDNGPGAAERIIGELRASGATPQ